MKKLKAETSSYRDHTAKVYYYGNRVFRRVNKKNNLNFKKFFQSKFYKANKNKIIKSHLLNLKELKILKFSKELMSNKNQWLEHEKLKSIIYPYEMCFDQLKDSALFYLELYIQALKNNYDMSDATPYNIQFKYNNPVYIDITSFKKLKKNSYFMGYKQFCESYLSPLLISSYTKINFNDLYKANFNGIDLNLTSKILPFYTFFNYNLFINIHLHSYLNSKIKSNSHKKEKLKKKKINLKSKLFFLENLRKIVKKLNLKKNSYWEDYSEINSYNFKANENKKLIVKNFLIRKKVKSLLDLGCNDGEYTNIAYNCGISKIYSIDNDGYSLNKLYNKFKNKKIEFHAIYQNFMDPSPNLGWMNNERKSFIERFRNNFDGLICLAFIHHICIGNNVPIEDFISYLSKFSNNILLEFVPIDDPMVKNMIFNKREILKNYSINHLKETISKNHKITNIFPIKDTKRTIFEFKKINK